MFFKVLARGGECMQRKYIAIDLKSFYASVECVDRGLDPLDTNLVVADISRTEKTICLAVTPSLKAYGISGRARLFEVITAVGEVNEKRRRSAPSHKLNGSSFKASELAKDSSLALDYITAPPRMALYMKASADIFKIYLKYVAPEDIHVYSIDEVFIDATAYLAAYGGSAHDMAMTMIRDVLKNTGITATAGIGTNLYLCKIAMDIVAKHIPADKDGVRIAELDEQSYRRILWEHKPITDFWRVGSGYAKKLSANSLYTMGDVARFSLTDYGTDKLYKLFGVNAELLIDHAWGYEPCTMQDIKSYRPVSNSISSGQVLTGAADCETTRLILWEMADMLALDLSGKGLVTQKLTLTVGYDVKNLRDSEIRDNYKGEVKKDHYGRLIPKHAHGTADTPCFTSSSKLIAEAIDGLFMRIYDKDLYSRRLCITACNVIYEKDIPPLQQYEQLDFFSPVLSDKEYQDRLFALDKEKELQLAVLRIKRRYGKNSILKGKNFLEGATAIERNGQIGGHKA